MPPSNAITMSILLLVIHTSIVTSNLCENQNENFQHANQTNNFINTQSYPHWHQHTNSMAPIVFIFYLRIHNISLDSTSFNYSCFFILYRRRETDQKYFSTSYAPFKITHPLLTGAAHLRRPDDPGGSC